MKKQHESACKACPWRKDSARGWLGDSTPIEFLQTSEAEHRMPCHLHVDYESERWEDMAAQAPQCAGRAIHFANRCKQPRDPGLLRLAPNRDEIFSNPQDFINHHALENPAPVIQIAGARVILIES